jgi:hypothetical protein
LTKIESHFISIQQQQQQKKTSFLDCYTANVFQRSLYTITVAKKREGGCGLEVGVQGGSKTMRAPRAGMWVRSRWS